MVERTCVDDHTGRPSTSVTDMNAARAKKLIQEDKSNILEIANITKKEEAEIGYSRLVSKSKRPVSAVAEFINPCQNEKNISVC
jgi:hypothetical protein